MCLESEFLGLEIFVIVGSRTCLTWPFQKPIFSTKTTEPRGRSSTPFCLLHINLKDSLEGRFLAASQVYIHLVLE